MQLLQQFVGTHRIAGQHDRGAAGLLRLDQQPPSLQLLFSGCGLETHQLQAPIQTTLQPQGLQPGLLWASDAQAIEPRHPSREVGAPDHRPLRRCRGKSWCLTGARNQVLPGRGPRCRRPSLRGCREALHCLRRLAATRRRSPRTAAAGARALGWDPTPAPALPWPAAQRRRPARG